MELLAIYSYRVLVDISLTYVVLSQHAANKPKIPQ